MRRAAAALLPLLYAAGSLFLAHGATRSWQHDRTAEATALGACALLLVAALVARHRHQAEAYDLRAELERAARPPLPRRRLSADEITTALSAACCERWWTSAGAEHDHSGKDQNA
ncbi:hypothetical protein [Streptomyces longwoodensis]|uniref:hypothetical protein n=1 Tax=Streptomyces longwoodensis TaxID=68231 RepID=UPI0033D38578